MLNLFQLITVPRPTLIVVSIKIVTDITSYFCITNLLPNTEHTITYVQQTTNIFQPVKPNVNIVANFRTTVAANVYQAGWEWLVKVGDLTQATSVNIVVR